MSVVENIQSTKSVQTTTSAAEAFRTITFDNSFDSELEQVEYHSSFEEAEWDPVGFDLTKSKNPDWKERNNQNQQPRRIQDIRLTRLDSGHSCEEEDLVDRPKEPTSDDDDWPYEEPGSPCALFGNKTNMSSSPAEGFEGEFSSGDPEWDNQDAQSKRSTGSRDRHRHNNHRKSSSRESSSRRLMQSQKQQQQQQQQQQQEEEDGSDHSAGSYELETASQSQSEEECSYSDESERSHTDSPTYDDDNLMVTPAMGKAREAQRKKPPTLKRGAHQVATPSIVKAMKDKQAFTVSDDDDNNSIDFDAEFDSDLESGSSAHSRKSKGGENGSRKGRSDSRYEAANNSFRRASMSKKNFKFDRSMSSADMKAARKANNSFKGHSDLNRSFSALSESKRRMNRTNSRRSEKMQGSFSSSSRHMHMSGRRLSSEKSPQGDARATRQKPSRAKSMGHPTAGTTKLKSALSKFSGSADEPPSAGGASGKKSYGSTLSALKVLSGADGGAGGGDGKGGGESDLKAAIMQQVYRSTSMNPIEIKRAPKPKMTKTNSLSASGMARAAAASGEFPPTNDAPSKETRESKHGRVRRSKTANERSNSDFSNGSYHESIAKMRKQKMADASERSEKSSKAKEEKEQKESSSSRSNVGRAKSFSYSSNRSGTNLDMAKSDSAENSPERVSSGNRPRMRRGSSKRLQTAQQPDGDAELTPSSSRRSMQKLGSRRSLQKERVYDATPQRPSGTNVITLLRKNEPVTDSQMMQKGNRQMFHALMFKTRMGIDMDELRRTVEGGDDDDDEASASDASR